MKKIIFLFVSVLALVITTTMSFAKTPATKKYHRKWTNTITLTSAAATTNQIVCAGSAITNITYSTTEATGATFSGLPDGVSGNWNNNAITISGIPTTAGTYNYTITLTGGSGTGTASGTITVKPVYFVNQPANVGACNNVATSVISFTGSAGTTFKWTNSNPAIGLPDRGRGDIPSFIPINTGTTPITANLSVTPDDSTAVYFNYTGAVQTWTVPAGITGIRITVIGASGGTMTNLGGYGGSAEGNLAVTPGQVLNIYVGGLPYGQYSGTGGFNGGGNGSYEPGGGGATDVRVSPYALANRVIVAGGGGGIFAGSPAMPYAGNGGGLTGTDGRGMSGTVPGATQTAAGNTGSGGGLGQGASATALGSGGGGGYYGGGGAQSSTGWANGGGGSGYVGGVTNAAMGTGVNSGNGRVIIAYPNLNCNGTTKNFTLTVNPTPTITTATPASQIACSGSNITSIVPAGSTVSGTVYNWTRDNTTTVTGMAASGSGTISGAMINTGMDPVTVTFTITPAYTNAGSSCTGIPITATVVVAPRPTAYAPSNVAVCNNGPVSQLIPAGNVGTLCGMANEGEQLTLQAPTGSIINFVKFASYGNATGTCGAFVMGTCNAPASVTRATEYFVGKNSATITVNSATFDADPCVGTAKHFYIEVTYTNAFTWTNSNTSIGLAASGTDLIPAFTAVNTTNAPVTATVTITPKPKTTNTVTFNYTGGEQSWTVPVGVTSIDITTIGASGGTASNAGGRGGMSKGTLAVTSGQVLKIYVGGLPYGGFSYYDPYGGYNGGGNGYYSNGGGGGTDVRVAPYALANRVIVAGGGGGFFGAGQFTPAGDGGGLVGGSGASDGQTVYGGSQTGPGTPGVNAGLGQGATATSFNGGGGGGGYYGGGSNGTYTGNCSGGGGSGYIGGVTNGTTTAGVNLGAGKVIISYTIPACTSIPATYTITVNPKPNVIPLKLSQIACSGTPIQTIALTSSVAGTQYTWARDNLADVTGMPDNGTGDISGTLINNTSAPLTVTFTIIPDYTNGGANCQGTILKATVVVNPSPNIDQPLSQQVCEGEITNAVTFSSPVAGLQYSWTNDNPSIGLAGSGSGNIPAFASANNSNVPVTANITVTGTLPGTAEALYVPYTGSNKVGVLDPSTNTQITSIAVGTNPFGTATSPDGRRVFVTNQGSNTVSVIDRLTNTVIATIPVGTYPEDIVASRYTGKIYVANNSSGTISVIDPATNTVETTITTASGMYGLAISPDGTTLYATTTVSNKILTISTATNSVTGTLSSSTPSPKGIVVSPDGSKTYTTNFTTNVYVHNTVTNALITTIPVGTTPYGIAINADGSRVYVTNNGSNNVSVINTATNTVTATIAVGTGPFGLSLSSDGSKLYVCNSNYAVSTISVINTANNTVTGTIPSGGLSSPTGFCNFVAPPIPACPSPAKTFTYTIKPAPNVITTPPLQTICSGSTISTISFTGKIAGTVYNWTRNNTASVTGIAASGTGSISGSLVNTTSVPASVVFTITPSHPSVLCAGAPVTATVIVLPEPVADQPGNQSLCNNAVTLPVNFTGATASTFNWTNSDPSIGLAASGTGDIPAFTAANTTDAALTATISVTAASRNYPGYAYVPATINNTVLVMDITNNTMLSSIPVGQNPWGVAASSDGSKVYISDGGSNDVSVISTATNSVIATISTGYSPRGVALNPDGSRLYVANFGNGSVYVFNTADNSFITSVATGGSPYDITVSPNGSTIYVSDYTNNKISVINAATNTITTTIPVGIRPISICMKPDGSRLYVVNNGSRTLSVINTAVNMVVATVPVENGPYNAICSPDGSKVYVSHANSFNVLAISTTTNTTVGAVYIEQVKTGVAISQDGSRLYITASDNNMYVASTATYAVLTTIPLGMYSAPLGGFIAPAISSCSGSPKTFTIKVNSPGIATIATDNTTQSLPVSGITWFSNACDDALITKLKPAGAAPVSGNTTAKVWIETVQDAQFVKRHYQITPDAGASTATAAVTLYFTQQEFDDFNAVNAVKLPSDPGDATGKSHLLVEKRSGVSSDGTGLPGTYSGNKINIDPDDANITWNADRNRWEITFDVTGFSGFFVKTQAGVLPIQLLSFKAVKQANDDVLLQWTTANEINANRYEVQRSIDGINFTAVGIRTAGNSNYQFIDTDPWTGDVRYYRLRSIDNDSRFTYSNIVRVNRQGKSSISIYPNPAGEVFTLQLGDSKLLHTSIKLIDAGGKLVQDIMITSQYQTVTVANLSKGIYLLRFADGSIVKLVKN